ncbi:putative ABC-type multidrug transport system, permease component [Parafrankia sp. Ea1.12]|nr:putative ABC-type multidrug transport system, permease component [Parafrankia sp. Ea1.12]
MLVIAGVDLRRRLRNRSALMMGFVGPLVLAGVFGLLISGTSSVTFTIGVVDQDGSGLTRDLVADLTAPARGDAGPMRFATLADTAAAERGVDDGDVDAALVLPAGFGAAVGGGAIRAGQAAGDGAAGATGDDGAAGGDDGAAGAGGPDEEGAGRGGLTTITVLRDPASPVAGQVADSIAIGVSASFNQVGLTLADVARRTGRPPSAAEVAAARDAAPVLTLRESGVSGTGVDPVAFYGAAMGILFLFFTVGFVARSLVNDRDAGILDRILAAPVRPGELIAGRALAVAALGTSGLVTVWAVTTVAFGAHWGPTAGVLPVLVATALAIAGVTLVVASLGRTEQQVGALTSLVAFALALAGGNFFGPGPKPAVLDRISLLTPNGWSLRILSDLAAGVATVESVLTAVAVLLVVAVVTGGIGMIRVRRVIFR